MRSGWWLGCGLAMALAGLAGCSDQGKVEAPMAAGGATDGASVGRTAEGTEAAAPRTPMSEDERTKAVDLKVISADRVEEKKTAHRWKVVVRVTNGTDIPIEGLELHAQLFPPGTVAPMAMHVREVLFDTALELDKERLIELEFPAAPSKVSVEDVRKEIRVGRLVKPVTPETKWVVLDESAPVVAKAAPTSPPDPQKELQKVQQQLVRPALLDPNAAGAGPRRQRTEKG